MFFSDSLEISRVVRSIAVIILLTPVFSSSQTEHKYLVHGRVVDKAGQPIRGAQVILDTGPPVDWEDLIESFDTDADGRFSIQETTGDPSQPQAATARTRTTKTNPSETGRFQICRERVRGEGQNQFNRRRSSSMPVEAKHTMECDGAFKTNS